MLDPGQAASCPGFLVRDGLADPPVQARVGPLPPDLFTNTWVRGGSGPVGGERGSAPAASPTAEQHDLHEALPPVTALARRYQSTVKARPRSSVVTARHSRAEAVASTSATRVRPSRRS